MELGQKLENFFELYRKEINITELIRKFNIERSEYSSLIDALYQLECQGKIYGSETGDYIHVPSDFYLHHGSLKMSSKNNYYLSLEKGNIIFITDKNLKDVKEGDYVFVETKKSEKHKKQMNGHIVRVASKSKIQGSFLYKATIKKEKTKDYYYIEIDHKKVHIPNLFLNTAYPNDTATVQVIYEDKQRYAKVIEILERCQEQRIFEYQYVNGEKIWIPLGTYPFPVELQIENETDFKAGTRILAKLSNNNQVKYIEQINNNGDLISEIESLAYTYGVPLEFSKETLKELEKLPTTISEEEIKKRVDLRNLATVTIDSKTAKDLDDAVSLEIKDGKYYLYVSIADVSYYVKPASNIFKDACQRGTSIYPANHVIPMLPPKLSNELCSLNPNEDKLTKTCLIVLDSNGNVLDCSIFNSIIRSNYKMQYDKVNNLLDGIEIDPDYVPYYKLLRDMNLLSGILQQKRLERGFLCFESRETEFDINETGTILGCHSRERGQSQLIIENFMLLANEEVASFVHHMDVPFMYRNHECPSFDQLSLLKNNLKHLNHYIKTLKNAQNPKIFQKELLTIFEGKSPEEVCYLSNIILRSMNRAYYDNNNTGHYGLALENYGTFTSPIRKLPDLINHTIIGNILDGNIEKLDAYQEAIKTMAEHYNEKELTAELLEKDVSKLLLSSYMSEFIDQTLEAKILFIMKDFIYIETPQSLYGTIPVSPNNVRFNTVLIDKEIFHVGDSMLVKIDYLKENSDEFVFSYISRGKTSVKKKIIK